METPPLSPDMTLADLMALLGKRDSVRWKCDWSIAKFDGDYTGEQIDAGLAGTPFEVIEEHGNLLTTAGATILWNALIGTGITAFSNANAYIGVGDSTTAETVGQTDLQAASNKLRKVMDATYPQVSTNSVVFRSTFASADANWTWQEWGVFNAAAAGTMLNRKVAANGTKAAGASWQFSVTLTLS